MDTLRSDGNAVEVTAPDAGCDKGDVIVANDFFGIAMVDADSGETLAIEIAQREHEIAIPADVAAAKGAILYLTAAGVIDDEASGNKAFLKVTVAKDSNNYVWGILLPQA